VSDADREAPSGGAGYRLALPLCAVLACLALGCDDPSLPLLASITDVGPAALEPGDVLRIDGSGFVEGPARVTLEGEFKPQGMAPPTRKVVLLDGAAVSGASAEVPISAASMARLAGEPARFRGSLVIDFPSTSGLGSARIAARIEEVELELRPTGSSVALAASRAREAARFLARLGISPVEGEDGYQLTVDRVHPESAADRVGIEPGDRLLAVDGTALASLSDLAGIPAASTYGFEIVTSSGAMRSVEIRGPLGAWFDRDETAAVVLAAMALGLFFSLAAPRRSSRPITATREGDPLTMALGAGLISLPLVLFPAVAVLLRSGYGTTALLIGATTLGLLIAVFAGAPRPWRRLPAFSARLVVLPTLLTVTAACGTSLGLWDLVAAQRVSPWGWNAWSSPLALLMTIAAIGLIWPSAAPSSHPGALSRFAGWLAAVAASMLLTACCLGGWNVPWMAGSEPSGAGLQLAIASLVFAAKCWVVLLTARWLAAADTVERRGDRGRNRLGLRVALFALGSAGALAWIWLDIPEPARYAGHVLATGGFTALVTNLLVNALRRRALARRWLAASPTAEVSR
jgi:hypothetical protein